MLYAFNNRDVLQTSTNVKMQDDILFYTLLFVQMKTFRNDYIVYFICWKVKSNLWVSHTSVNKRYFPVNVCYDVANRGRHC